MEGAYLALDFPRAVRYSWPQIILGKLLALMYRFLGIFSDVLFPLIYGSTTQCLPPIKNDLLMKSGTQLAGMIRVRQVSSEKVVSAFIERIREINPILNCVTELRCSEALEEARCVDRMLASDARSQQQLAVDRPFLGVPFSTKDSVAVQGMLHTAGLWSRRRCVATRDAPVVALLRAAGAILLAHTNVPELCMWWDTCNTVFGRSSNPYSTTRIVGGSSGGEACLLAAAGSPMGVGSDIGGSIRMPCFFNGIHGLKPSSDIVSNEGQIPVPCGMLNTFQVTGPMSRHAEDLRAMMHVLAGDNIRLLRLSDHVTLSSVKIFYVDEDCGFPLCSPVSVELRAAISRLVDLLRTEHEVCVQRLRVPALFHQLQMWTNKMHTVTEAPSFAQELADDGSGNGPPGASISLLREMARWCLRCSKHTLAGLSLAAIEKTLVVDPTYTTMCDQLRLQLNQLLSSSSLLLYPSHPTVAPYHNQPLFKSCNFAYTAVFNVLQLPVVQLPLGLSPPPSRLPLGVQLVAGERCDHLLLSAAEQIEKLTGGWQLPQPC